MRYTVRTPEGELTLPSRAELERAVEHGMVGPEDEVREEGATAWRRVGTVPGLPQPGRTAGGSLPPGQRLQLAGVTLLGAASLWACLSGRPAFMALGAAGAFGLVGWLFALTRSAFQLKRRR
jgi:hypothetical protein